MSHFVLSRRKLLKGGAALGALGVTAGILPVRLARAADPAVLAGIRADLPILILSGDADPIAGGGAALQVVAQRYRDAGVRDVELTLYPQARHELLNETNRDEVTARIVGFLDRTIGR